MRTTILVVLGASLGAAPAAAQLDDYHRMAARSMTMSARSIEASAIALRAAAPALAELQALGPALRAPAFARDAVPYPTPSAYRLQAVPQESWAPQDPADSLWRAARELLNNGDHARSAALYQRLRTETRFRSSEYRAASYFWEAFVRHRIGTTRELQLAQRVLRELRRDHPRYEGMADVSRLEAAIEGQLAQRGNEPAARNLAEAAQNPQCQEQQYIVEALMHLPAEQAVPILQRVMARRDCDKLREHAVFLLSQKRTPETERLLLEAVRNDPSNVVRERAVFWLSQVNSEAAVAALDDIVRTSTDRKVLEAAVFALSQHRSERATALLRDIATRANAPAEVRANAVFWLGQRRDPQSSAFLRNLYGQVSDQQSKEQILFAMSQRRDSANAEWLMSIALDQRETEHIRKHALFLASQHGQLPVARLGELYRRSNDRAMKKHILFALSQNRSQEAGTVLMEIVRNERDLDIRKDGVFWLSQRARTDPRIAPFLAELIGG